MRKKLPGIRSNWDHIFDRSQGRIVNRPMKLMSETIFPIPVPLRGGGVSIRLIL